MLIRVDFLCNDPDTGNANNRFEAVQWNLGNGYAALELGRWPSRPLPFTDNGHSIRILRRWYSYEQAKGYYGNWCWSAYWLKPPVAKALLRHLRASGKLHCDGGPTKLYDWWGAYLRPTADARGLNVESQQ